MATRQPISVQEFTKQVVLRYEAQQYVSAPAAFSTFGSPAFTSVPTGGTETLVIPSYPKAKSVSMTCNAELAFVVENTIAIPAPVSLSLNNPWVKLELLNFAINGFRNRFQITPSSNVMEFSVSSVRSLSYNDIQVIMTHNAQNYIPSLAFSPSLTGSCRIALQVLPEVVIKF